MKKANILLAEDEASIRKIIKKYLELNSYEVFEAENGKLALETFKSNDIDLCILDIMMPEIDGYELTSTIRKTSDVPIILLTARGLEDDKIRGFKAGTDDYITKPFSSKEVILRVEALLKRAGKHLDNSLSLGELSIDIGAMRVAVSDKNIDLSKKEFDCLLYLLRNKGIALSREQIIEKVWGYGFEGGDRTVDTTIKRLRKKLGDYGKHIVAIRGYGYKLEAR